MYLVEIFDTAENCWRTFSWHKNEEYAVIQVDIMHESKGCPMRAVFEGKIIYQRP